MMTRTRLAVRHAARYSAGLRAVRAHFPRPSKRLAGAMAARVDLLAPAVVRVAASVCPRAVTAERTRQVAHVIAHAQSASHFLRPARERPLAVALTPPLRRHSDPEDRPNPGLSVTPLPGGPTMLSLHPLSRKVMRLGIAACGLAALAA